MDKKKIYQIIAKYLKDERAKKVAIFGSYTRDEEKKLNALKKLIAKSEFTEEDANELAKRVKQSMHKITQG